MSTQGKGITNFDSTAGDLAVDSLESSGNITGNLVGNVTGSVTGNVTGNLTGTASEATLADSLVGGQTDATANFDGSTGHKALTTTPGTKFLTKSSAGLDYTLANPSSTNGQIVRIVCGSAAAHVVTTSSNLGNGALNTITFDGNFGSSVELISQSSHWTLLTKNGASLSLV
jgi:hypothetical protein